MELFKGKSENAKSQHRHLVRTKLFWSALLVPITFAAILGGVIVWNTDLGAFCGTSRCVQNFFGHFKFPLTVAGLALPLVAMVAAIHRSMEAAIQIDLANKQYGEALKNNRFGNYLKHRESFEKLVDGYCARNYYNAISKTKIASDVLYVKLFPRSGYARGGWNGEHDPLYLKEQESYARNALAEIGRSDGGFDPDVFFWSVKSLLSGLCIDYLPMRGFTAKLSDGQQLKFGVVGIESEISAIASSLRDAVFVLRLLKGFVGDHDFEGLSLYTVFSDVADKLGSASDLFSSEQVKFA